MQSTEYNKLWLSNFASAHSDPNQLRWRPFELPTESLDFIQGIATVAGAGA
jgi:homogentisate 1,2-dioxygenase